MSMLYTTIMFHDVRLLTSSLIYTCCSTQHWERGKWKVHLLAKPRL